MAIAQVKLSRKDLAIEDSFSIPPMNCRANEPTDTLSCRMNEAFREANTFGDNVVEEEKVVITILDIRWRK